MAVSGNMQTVEPGRQLAHIQRTAARPAVGASLSLDQLTVEIKRVDREVTASENITEALYLELGHYLLQAKALLGVKQGVPRPGQPRWRDYIRDVVGVGHIKALHAMQLAQGKTRFVDITLAARDQQRRYLGRLRAAAGQGPAVHAANPAKTPKEKLVAKLIRRLWAMSYEDLKALEAKL